VRASSLRSPGSRLEARTTKSDYKRRLIDW